MKITNEKVVNSLTALQVLDASKLTVKGAFAMRKNRARLLDEARHINEAHAQIFKKHFGLLAHADDKHPQWLGFKKDVDELMALETDIAPQKIKSSDILEAAPGLIKALDDLNWLIDDCA